MVSVYSFNPLVAYAKRNVVVEGRRVAIEENIDLKNDLVYYAYLVSADEVSSDYNELVARGAGVHVDRRLLKQHTDYVEACIEFTTLCKGNTPDLTKPVVVHLPVQLEKAVIQLMVFSLYVCYPQPTHLAEGDMYKRLTWREADGGETNTLLYLSVLYGLESICACTKGSLMWMAYREDMRWGRDQKEKMEIIEKAKEMLCGGLKEHWLINRKTVDTPIPSSSNLIMEMDFKSR